MIPDSNESDLSWLVW